MSAKHLVLIFYSLLDRRVIRHHTLQALVYRVINNFTMYLNYRIMGIPHILEITHENRSPKAASCTPAGAAERAPGHLCFTKLAPWSGATSSHYSYVR